MIWLKSLLGKIYGRIHDFGNRLRSVCVTDVTYYRIGNKSNTTGTETEELSGAHGRGGCVAESLGLCSAFIFLSSPFLCLLYCLFLSDLRF